MMYVIHTNPTEGRSWVLALDGYRTRAAAAQAIAWQVRGGADAGEFRICTYDPKRNRFVSRPEDQVRTGSQLVPDQVCTWSPGHGPYTPEVWGSFCERISYNPDAD